MTDILVTSPFRPFTLPTQFKAVFNGHIYCGTVDAVDPSVSQVQVYLVNESGDKIPVAQPLRTNAGGFMVYNGQPAKFVTDANHSLLVQDSFHVQVWYEPNVASIDPATAVKVMGHPLLEFYGISSANTAIKNAQLLRDAIVAGESIGGSNGSYTFDFTGITNISTSATSLHLDLGFFKHTFINFPGIVGVSCENLFANYMFSAAGGYCKGFGKFVNAKRIVIINFEITDVLIAAPTAGNQFFGLEYSSSAAGDNSLAMYIENLIIKNVVTVTNTTASGLAIPMTVLGNFGSSSTQSQAHEITIGNMCVDGFYSVASDQVTIIDGDGDIMRMFTNPTLLAIKNCTLNNVGKRFIKTQEKVVANIGNLYAKLDARFDNSNFVAILEGQALAQTSGPTVFHVDYAEIDFSASPSIDPGPRLFTATTLQHEITIKVLRYKNCSFYSSNQNVLIRIHDAEGTGLSILATGSNRVRVDRLVDQDVIGIVCAMSRLSDFNVKVRTRTSTFPLDNTHLQNGSINNMDVDSRVATVLSIKNVALNYTTGTAVRRPFRPVAGKTVIVEGLTVNSILAGTQTFESPGGAGTMIIRDYRSTNQTLALFSSGAWSFILDNCVDDTVAGAGAVSIKRASYV